LAFRIRNVVFPCVFQNARTCYPEGWNGILGNDKKGNGFRLSCLYFGEHILWATTAVRKQDLEFPEYDLLDQLDTCELGIRLKKFRKARSPHARRRSFRPVFERFCERYNAHPSHSMGSFPFEGTWDFKNGWQKR
jgi:hypothetical protein